jgi:hypothetical protein
MVRIDTKRNPKLRQELRVGCSLFALIVRLLGLGSQGIRGMGRRPSLGLFIFYLTICIGAVTGVTQKWFPRQTTAAGSGGRELGDTQCSQHWELPLAFARSRTGRTTMKHFVLSIALSALVIVAASATTQAAYYHHRHHHYWHHGYPIAGYWNYYRTSWPRRGNNEESTR